MPGTVNLAEVIRKGIRPDSRFSRGFLRELTNLRPGPWGAKDILAVNQPFDDGDLDTWVLGGKDWPFPQLFVGKGVSLLCYEDHIREVVETAGDWSSTAITTYSGAAMDSSLAVTRAITSGGGPWHFVDFWTTWLLFNDKNMIFRVGSGNTYVVSGTGAVLECMTNYGFTGSAASWALGADWSYAANAVSKVAGGAPSSVSQAAASWQYPIREDEPITVEIVVTALGGTGGLTLTIGAWSQAITAAGSYTYPYIRSTAAPATVVLMGAAAATATVSSISVKCARPTIRTGANWQDGRAVLAGFVPEDFYGITDWPGFIDDFYTEAPDEVKALLADITAGAGSNWVWYGTIGGDDLLWLVSMDLLKYKSFDATPDFGYNDTHPYILDLLQRAQFGMAPMPWQGRIMAARQLGPHMVVYGGYDVDTYKSGGIAALTNHEGGIVGVSHPKGLGPSVGVYGRCCVAGDETQHVFMDEACELWAMGPDLSPERLGYKHKLTALATDDPEIVMSFDPEQREVYIANSGHAYLLTSSGLCRAPWSPTTVSFAQGGRVAVKFDGTDEYAMARTGIIQDSGKGSGILEWVRIVGVDSSTDEWTVSVYFRNKQSDNWYQTAYQAVDGRGVTHFNIHALQFIVEIKSDDRTKVDFEDIEVSFGDGKPELIQYATAATGVTIED
jgi:hypothetical protein